MSSDPKNSNSKDRPWVRSQPVKAMFNRAEYADLEIIAEGWGVPVATAMWAIVVSELARWRRQAPEYGQHGISIAAAITVLRLKSVEADSDTTPATNLGCGRGD